MDLFIIDCLDDDWSKWSRPRRFIQPINSTSDDSQPFFNSATGYLYFSSKRDGSSDIFRVKIAPPNPAGVVVKGHIYNSNTNRPISGKVLSGPADQVYRNVYVSDDGSFRFVVPKGEEFLLKAFKPGYSGVEEKVKFKKSYIYFKEYEVDLYLDPLEIGSKIELDPIYFVQSKPTVLSTSYPTLNILAAYLKENQNISIRIHGHTDNQGEEALLQKLSEERADAIKEYLVYKMRIAPLRIETIGYGSTKPVNDNSTDELRKQNRRVEFEIIKIYKDPALGLKNEKNNK
jgi:outer membrane protein OmpA-like peptidoglycan-associated protein